MTTTNSEEATDGPQDIHGDAVPGARLSASGRVVGTGNVRRRVEKIAVGRVLGRAGCRGGYGDARRPAAGGAR